MALTVSASSSDWPLQASDGECPLVWDKLGRQGQCLPAGWSGGGVRGQRRAGASWTGVSVWPFLLWISMTLSSEAHAFGHGFS